MAGGLAALGAVGAAAASPAAAEESQHPGGLTAYLWLYANGVQIQGGVTLKGLEKTIEVLYFDQSAEAPLTGARKYSAITMRKPVDKATPLITKALATNQVVDASVRFYRPGAAGGAMVQNFRVETKEGRLVRQNLFSPDNEMLGAGKTGRMLEEFAFTFSTITWSSVFGPLVTFTDEIGPPD